jgi:ssDNA-binding Zn-finger/Zn-ribbon topoisomerase 1
LRFFKIYCHYIVEDTTNKNDTRKNTLLLYKANKPFYKSLATQHKPIARALVEKINDDYLKKNNGECPDCQTKMIRRGKNRAGFCCFYCPKCKKFRTGSEGTYF